MSNDEKQEHMATMGRVWLAWLIFFLFAEGYAIRKGGGTLSTFIRRYFQISDKAPLKYRAPRWVAWVVIIVLAIHFLVPSA